MRVDFYPSTETNEVSSLKDKTGDASVATVLSRRPEDTTSLKTGSDFISSLTAQTMQSGSARAERVSALQQLVSSGTYHVESSKIADAMAGS